MSQCGARVNGKSGQDGCVRNAIDALQLQLDGGVEGDAQLPLHVRLSKLAAAIDNAKQHAELRESLVGAELRESLSNIAILDPPNVASGPVGGLHLRPLPQPGTVRIFPVDATSDSDSGDDVSASAIEEEEEETGEEEEY